jgi:hypothetical protein
LAENEAQCGKVGCESFTFWNFGSSAYFQVITPYPGRHNFFRLRINASGFLLVAENCSLLGYYSASGRNSLPTFQDNLSVPSSGVKIPRLLNSRFLTPEEKTDHPLCHSPRRAQFTSTSRRKPEFTPVTGYHHHSCSATRGIKIILGVSMTKFVFG